MESTSTAVSNWLALMFLISSMPEPLASEMSTIAMSGLMDSTSRNASGALSVSPQIWKSGRWLIKLVSHSRTSGWSSTSRILILCAMSFSSGHTAGRKFTGDARAGSGQTPNVEGRADHVGTVGHDAQSHSLAGACLFGQADAIVGNGQRDDARCLFEADVDVFGLPMPDGVGDGFLRDAIQMGAA